MTEHAEPPGLGCTDIHSIMGKQIWLSMQKKKMVKYVDFVAQYLSD